MIGVLMVCASVEDAGAAPITWEYTGTVESTADASVVAVGTAATVRVTVDPAANYLDTFANTFPDSAGVYFGDLEAAIGAMRYHLAMALELNYDPVYGIALPGLILMREFGWAGPAMFGSAVDSLTRCGTAACADLVGSAADPASDGLPMHIDPLRFPIRFLNGSQIGILASDPQVVPEPTPLLLLGPLLIGSIYRSLQRRRGGR